MLALFREYFLGVTGKTSIVLRLVDVEMPKKFIAASCGLQSLCHC